jgi:TM2 domain-containing membrane protein YozV
MTHPNQPRVVVAEGRNVVIGYVLLILLGTFGVHRMYLGKWVTGLTQLVLFWAGSATTIILIGWIPLAVWGVWILWDLVTLPLQTAAVNARLRQRAVTYGY